jgi:hypothetical protein
LHPLLLCDIVVVFLGMVSSEASFELWAAQHGIPRNPPGN